MTNGRGEMFGETAKTYAKELLMARIGIEIETPTTYAMEWGIEHEPDARKIYANSRNIPVELPGFIQMQWNVGCTPDGVIRGDGAEHGLLEIKCPQEKAHFNYLLSDEPPKQYWQQMQFQMMVTGAKWCDWMTFNPLFPDNLKAKVIRVARDQDYIDLILSRIDPFEDMISEMKLKLGL
jgi:exodeoxyribonuclease (lambda-induced)